VTYRGFYHLWKSREENENLEPN